MRASAAEVAEVIVVFGAALAPDGTPGPALVRRIDHAVALWRAGRGRLLLCSGGCVAAARSEAAVMAELARAAGVPPSCIVEEAQARNTWQNAVYSAALLRAHGWGAVLLVSERYHLPRARLACRLAGLPVRASSGPGHPPGRGRARRLWFALREAAACVLMLGRWLWACLRQRGA